MAGDVARNVFGDGAHPVSTKAVIARNEAIAKTTTIVIARNEAVAHTARVESFTLAVPVSLFRLKETVVMSKKPVALCRFDTGVSITFVASVP
jgi:hypothetical protein